MKNIYTLLLGAVALFATGCSDDFGDMNTPSDATTTVEPKFFFNKMETQVFRDYQRVINLYGDLYSQYWSNTVNSFESGRYEYNNDWVGRGWEQFYTEILRRSVAIDEMYGENELYQEAIAIKNVWMVYYWSRMTDYYGDMPYFNAGTGESVPYTSQEEIYRDLFKVLDEAIPKITGDAAQYQYGSSYDLIYGGDVMKWKRFANSLRLRLAMRVVNADPALAETQAKAAINGEGGLMQSNDDNGAVPTWNKGWNDYINQMGWYWRNIAISKTLTDYCYNQSSVSEDPRASIWFCYKPDGAVEAMDKEDAGKAKYEGCPNGLDILSGTQNNDYCIMRLEGGFPDFTPGGNHTMLYTFMNYSEVKFLLAEAALRGWYSGDVESLYEEGIEASMQYCGVASADIEAYIDGLNATINTLGSNEEKLKQIITQKWMANFPNGLEAWADFRRTDYPDFNLPVDQSANASVAIGKFVKRIRYNENEHRNNEDMMPEALNTTEKDRMDHLLWWDTTETLNKSNGLMNSNF